MYDGNIVSYDGLRLTISVDQRPAGAGNIHIVGALRLQETFTSLGHGQLDPASVAGHELGPDFHLQVANLAA
jgi:hypothetical protein